MNAGIFAEWLRAQGYHVFRTASSYWYDAGPRVLQAFPYHWVIRPTEKELLDCLVQNRAIALRYSTPVDNTVGRLSYHAVYDKPNYKLNDLERRTRQNIRKGMKNCRVESVPFELLAEDGWLLETDTATRQGRKVMMSKDIWRKRYLSAADLPGFEAWGAFAEDRLVASLITFQMEDCCEMISQQCHRDYLKARVNNALSFLITQKMVERIGIKSIFYTIQSLNAPASVDEFKFRMGYRAKPVRQRIVFHPVLAPIFNKFTYSVVQRIFNQKPENSSLAKMEGMLRYYLEGKYPLTEQDWPNCLIGCKFGLDEAVSYG